MSSPRAGAGPVLWLASAQYFIVQAVVALASTVGYSWSANYISDLGNTKCASFGGRAVCSPLHLVMNASFVVLGLTMLGGGVLVGRQLAGGSRAAWVGFACLGLAGVGTIVVGVFPENTVAGVHKVGAALPFVLGNVGVVLVGASVRRVPTGVRTASVVTGLVGLVGLGLFLAHRYVGLRVGGMERVTAYPQDVWLIGIGAYLLARPVPDAAPSGRP